MRRSFLIFVALCLILSAVACDMLAPEAYEPVTLSLRFARQAQGLAKEAAVQTVWAVVADYNPWYIDYDDPNYTHDEEEGEHPVPPDGALWNLFSTWDPVLYQNRTDTTQVWRLGLDTRQGWRSYLAGLGVTILSDQLMTLQGDTAVGTLTGTVGSNWLILGVEQEEGKVTHYYSYVYDHLVAGDTTVTVWDYNFQAIPQR